MAVGVDDLAGLWRRTLYKRRWRRGDRVTAVFWLQGPRLFVDIRQPTGRPDFAEARYLRALQSPHVAWMARQHGFAGALDVTGGVAEWHRAIDFQPGGGPADRARLRFQGAILREDGIEARYYELWRREVPPPAAPCWGVRLHDPISDVEGFLVRVGADFMLARGRTRPLPLGGSLEGLLAATARLEQRQDLVDCELALGRIDAASGDWRVERSTLPFREGALLRPRLDPAEPNRIRLADLSPLGLPIERTWQVVEADSLTYCGDLADTRQAEAV